MHIVDLDSGLVQMFDGEVLTVCSGCVAGTSWALSQRSGAVVVT